MLAGHETTANAMSWFWYLMALNPDARTRMLAEVDSALAGCRPSAHDLVHLPWTTRAGIAALLLCRMGSGPRGRRR